MVCGVLSNSFNPGAERVVLVFDRCLVMAGGAVAQGPTLGRIGVHVNFERVPAAMRACRSDVLWFGDHG